MMDIGDHNIRANNHSTSFMCVDCRRKEDTLEAYHTHPCALVNTCNSPSTYHTDTDCRHLNRTRPLDKSELRKLRECSACKYEVEHPIIGD